MLPRIVASRKFKRETNKVGPLQYITAFCKNNLSALQIKLVKLVPEELHLFITTYLSTVTHYTAAIACTNNKKNNGRK